MLFNVCSWRDDFADYYVYFTIYIYVFLYKKVILQKIDYFWQVPLWISSFWDRSYISSIHYIYISYIYILSFLSFVRDVCGILGFGAICARYLYTPPYLRHSCCVLCISACIYCIYLKNISLHWWYSLTSFQILATRIDGMTEREEKKWKVFIFFLRRIVRSPQYLGWQPIQGVCLILNFSWLKNLKFSSVLHFLFMLCCSIYSYRIQSVDIPYNY